MSVSRLGSLLAGAALLLLTTHGAHAQPRVIEADLVSDIDGRALHTDPHLANPWGIAFGPSGIAWVSDNHTDVSTLYDSTGTARSLVVSIPHGSPTGVMITPGNDSSFAIPSGDTTVRAIFIFATEAGTVAAWSNHLGDPTSAVTVDSVTDGIFKGLAIGHGSEGLRLYVADFHNGLIRVLNRHFEPVPTAGDFTDATLPAGYAPFNVAVINHQLLVAYAQQDANKQDDVPGAGLGFVDVFDLSGHLLHRLIANGALNAPWAMVASPGGWAGLPAALLVGNFGDGRINAYDPGTGAFIAAIQDSAAGSALSIEGLWGLSFGIGPVSSHQLFFAAGIGAEAHGLFGVLRPAVLEAPPPPPPSCSSAAVHGLQFWARSCGEFPGHPHFVPPGLRSLVRGDSLQGLLACVAAGSKAFGAEGCFHANCELLTKRGHRTAREHAAQQLLALSLNRCSGALCDTSRLRCGEDEEGDDDGDDDHDEDHSPGSIHTVGDLFAQLDDAVCSGSNDHLLHRLFALAACVNGGENEGEDEDGDHDRPSLVHSGVPLGLMVQALSNPAHLSGTGTRFLVSALAPATVGFRIYDASGRLVAEPLRNAPMTGQLMVSWNGRDARGMRVPPGTYFYRAHAGGEVTAGRFVMIH